MYLACFLAMTQSCLTFVQSSPIAAHWLPAKVKFDGKAPVEQYFLPENDGDHQKACLRGRAIKGRTVQLPDNYQGFLLELDSKSGDSKQWKSKLAFKEVTYWNYDCHPSNSDPAHKCLEWLSIASKMHEPISTELVNQELQKLS